MSLISGEAIQEPNSKKLGYVIKHSDGTVLSEPGYEFNTQKEAEDELIKVLKKLGKNRPHS